MDILVITEQFRNALAPILVAEAGISIAPVNPPGHNINVLPNLLYKILLILE